MKCCKFTHSRDADRLRSLTCRLPLAKLATIDQLICADDKRRPSRAADRKREQLCLVSHSLTRPGDFSVIDISKSFPSSIAISAAALERVHLTVLPRLASPCWPLLSVGSSRRNWTREAELCACLCVAVHRLVYMEINHVRRAYIARPARPRLATIRAGQIFR